MIKLKHKILLIMLLMLGIGAGNSWAQVLMDIKDLTSVVTNNAGTKYVSNGQFSWTAGLRGADDANVITAGGKKFLRLNMGAYKTQHLKMQFAQGKIHAGDHLVMEVARVAVQNETPGLGFTIVKQATNNNQPSYNVDQTGYPGEQMSYANSENTSSTYKIDYILKEDDINNVGVNLQNIVIAGFWWDATAVNRIMIVRHSAEESLPEISVIAPTSNTLTLARGQEYTLKAEVSGGEYKPGIVWRSYTSATPTSQHVGTNPHYLNDATEWTYTAPTTPGTYYIGADAQQLCVDKNADGSDRYEGPKPYVITVTVVDHSLPKINVSAPTTKTITLGVGQKYTFSATASDGESNRGVVWRQYHSATPQYTYVGNNGSIDGTAVYRNNYEYTAPTTPGTYYIGADAQHQLSDKSYKSSTPYVVTVNVVEHKLPTIEVSAPTTKTLELVAGQAYVFKAHASGGEENPTVVWRQYHSATPQYTYVGNNGSIETLSYDDELTYIAPTTPGTYYIGADAQQVCKVEKNSDGTDKYEGSAPYVITVNVVDGTGVTTENRNLSFAYNGETKTRQYRVYVPSGVLSSPSTKVPVVFSLHGAARTNELTDWGVQNFNNIANTNNFIVVYPQGRKVKFPFFSTTDDGDYGWESTGAINEDTEFFKAIIADLSSGTSRDEYKNGGNMKFTIDPSRIYITGYSNGGEMAYACANAMPEVFAAYSSISGLQMNEMHMQHHGSRPVPFIHIHGTKDDFVKYSYMPTIIDNMIFRNGNNMTPVNQTTGSASYWNDAIPGNETSGYKKSEYTGGAYPYVYYEIGDGMKATDKGMGHSADCTIDRKNSKQIFWEFMSQYSLPANTTDPVEFSAKINTAYTDARAHGWQINNGGVNIAQYGESGGYTTAGQNVYHSLQLNKGVHYISFNVAGTSTNYVSVRLTRLAPLSAFDKFRRGSVAGEYTETLVLDKAYRINQNSSICVKFDNSEDVASEYTLTILKGAPYDDTTISNVLISTNGRETSSDDEVKDRNTDFAGYYKYNNRLVAQWDFDLCDNSRFDLEKMNNNSATWNADYGNTDGTDAASAKYGKIIYTYNKTIANFAELTYDGVNDVIPIAAGLTFKTANNNNPQIKIQADLANGEITGVHLMLGNNVQMTIPYVENTYRNDKESIIEPENNTLDFENCLHHIKRDIVYIATVSDQPDYLAWNHEFNRNVLSFAGDEYVNGKTYKKSNYIGENNQPCILQFRNEDVIDRIGVNRNLTYSFYTQYINELGYTTPQPRMRIVGSPVGQKVANVGTSQVTYTNAIAMTYGGWENSEGSRDYTAFNNTPVTDSWNSLTENSSSVAVDGFSKYSMNSVAPTSESLMPNEGSSKYHPAWEGKFNTSYVANYTPWTLPCRGGYLKFEPTTPGVLNVNVFQKGKIDNKNTIYYIVDEFGNRISTSEVYCKTSTGQSVNKTNDGFYTTTDSYVKYSYNVYPGKTYYMFSVDAGIGFAGFYFEPYVYRKSATNELARLDVELKKLNLVDGTAYAYPESLSESPKRTVTSPGTNGEVSYTIHSDNKAVEVTLNRSFAANTWNSICLPFSMNNNAMEEVFGKGTRVVLLRDVQDKEKMESGKTTANFIAHENQDIIAGYPYFILPTKAVEKITTNAYIPTTTASIPVISGKGFKTTTGVSIGEESYEGLDAYSFTGTLTGMPVEQGSYYMNTSGNLARYTGTSTTAKLKPYRAYLHFEGSDTNGSKVLGAIFLGNPDDNLKEGDATSVDEISIEDILLKNGILTQSTNVYNMQGQIIRQNVTNLQGLPKGAYIVNGKKYVIK